MSLEVSVGFFDCGCAGTKSFCLSGQIVAVVECAEQRGTIMSNADEILANAKAAMVMENMPLSQECVKRINAYLNDEKTLQQCIDQLRVKHQVV